MGVGHSDCAPGSPGAERYARQGPTALQDSLAILSAAHPSVAHPYGGPAPAPVCDSGHWIKTVSRNGAVIVLEDGSVFMVDAVDQIDTALWLPITNITVCPGHLVNVGDGKVAGATRVH